MSRGLEALNEMLNMDIGIIRTNRIKKGDDYTIVHKELKALEIIKKTVSTDLHFDYEEDTERWYVWIDCEGYQVYIFEGQGKEEYDLLREVLL